MNRELFNSVICCTKDRPSDLADFLASLMTQTRRPEEVIIVDASQKHSNIYSLSKSAVSIHNIIYKYHHTRPNLAFQRNFAVSKVDPKSDIVTFFDDDIILDKDYLRHVIGAFERDKDNRISGVCGRISNEKKPNFSILKKIFLLYSKDIGRVLPSGFNTRNTSDLDREATLQWMPGGISSYRRHIFEKLAFDDYYSHNGVGGEDVDFSYRASKEGHTFLYVPDARLIHKESSYDRDELHFGYTQIAERHHFLRKNMNRAFNIISFFWAVFGICLINLFSTLMRPGSSRKFSARFLGNIKGLLRCCGIKI